MTTQSGDRGGRGASTSPFRRKPIEAILHQNDPDGSDRPGLAKRLRTKDLIAFGIGMIVGTGIFTLTGIQAKQNAGPAVVISFLVAGFVALLAALCYAELAAAVPTAGSAYTYTYATVGEIFAWIIAWDLVLEFALGAAVVARGWSGYLQSALHLPSTFLGEDSAVNLGAVAIVLALGYVAARGIQESKWVTNALVVVKVSVCVFIILVGAFYVKTANWSPFVPKSAPPSTPGSSGLTAPLWQSLTGVNPSVFGVSGILAAAAVVFFAYSGFEVVANLGEEAEEPARDMPRGLLGSLVICTLLYVGVCLVLTGMVKYSDLSSGAPLADAFDRVGMSWAGVLIAIAAVCGLTSVILVDIIGMGRIAFALTRDGLLPASVGKVHPRWHTPVRITTITTVVVALMAAVVPLDVLAEMVSIGTLFAFMLVSIAVIVLRRTDPDMERPFRTPFVPLLPALSALMCLVMMASLETGTWLRFVIWLALGLVVYFLYGRRNAALARDGGPTPR